MSVTISNGELLLYGFVGESYWGEGFTALEVQEALTEHGWSNDVTVRVNSGGGYIDDGIAIYNALTAHKGQVTMIVDAVAASAASVIAMAGDEIVMRSGAMMMIHDPAGYAFGTAEDHEKSCALLDKQADQMASIYADRSGQAVEDVRQAMKDTTWMTGDEAVEQGYADRTDKVRSLAATAFDYRIFSDTPKKLVALASRKGWSFDDDDRSKAATAAPTRQSKETSMAGNTAADDTTAAERATAKSEGASEAKARIKAIMTCEEAEGREGLAEHLAYDTELPPEETFKILAASPKTTAAGAADGEPETDPADPKPADFERRRLAAAGQAAPGQVKGSGEDGQSGRRTALKPGAIYAARRDAQKKG